MPYVKKSSRPFLEPESATQATSPGELNYQLTVLARRYVAVNGLSYQTINDVVGALEGTKAEFQRRVVALYEDTKIATNGDVYP